jgi:signal transduction histidine kinase
MAYAAALAGTMLVFSIALWTTHGSGAYDDMERHVSSEADRALNTILQTERTGQSLTEERDTLAGPVDTLGAPMMVPSLRTVLDDFPDYVIVLGPGERILYLSLPVQKLSADDRTLLMQVAVTLTAPGPVQVGIVGQQLLFFAVRTPQEKGSAVSRVVVASALGSRGPEFGELVTTMLVTAPLLLIASVALAYAIAGRAFRPIERMIDEVQAITDGRSLHRRLPVDAGGDEIGRLALTLNEMIERLAKSFSGLRRFTADASHELKTPLTVLRADVERAMNPRSARGERLVALEEALQETTRMADLVDSLLTLARADEGRFDLHRERVELEPLVRDVFETVAILGEAAGLGVSMPAPEAATVLGDRARLRQLFLNLGINAIKYTPSGGSVELSLVRHGSTTSFSVRDTGIGISAADLPHVFERFYRADRARSRSTERGGFGLGLAIAQWIAEAHGGTIAARSRLGRGSTFTVTLPLMSESDRPDETGHREASLTPDSARAAGSPSD